MSARGCEADRTENVVFSYAPEHTPAIRFHTIPSSCVGQAETLADARNAYRAELCGLLRIDRRELPPVIEHVEAKVHGMLVRDKVGAVRRDPTGDRMLLQTLLAEGPAQEELRAYLDGVCGEGAEPVVVLAESQDTVGSVLDQMTATDTVVVAYADPARVIGWAAIYGPEADGAADVPRVADPRLDRLPLGALARTHPRVRLDRLPHAS